MKKIIPLNNYEQSIITGACAIHFDEPILHFGAHNHRKRMDTLSKSRSREKAQWVAENFEGEWLSFLLFYGAITGQDKSKLANGIHKIFVDHHPSNEWIKNRFTLDTFYTHINDLLWMCDHAIIIEAKRQFIHQIKSDGPNILDHFEEYAEKVIGFTPKIPF